MRTLTTTWILFIYLLLLNDLGAQCSIPSQVPINDKDTTLVSFVIESAQLDDLSLNGVCGFNIEFTHDFIGDVSIILISPSGQEVQLVGPSELTSPNTQFITWDVNFIPCGFSASPDPGIFPIWNNQNNWFTFTTYTGSYYPNVGCLEDLNSGPVNGLWTVKVIDAVDFGSGVIEDMNIVFCDPTGIECNPCEAEAGSFEDNSLDFCEGQEQLRFVPTVDFGSTDPDTSGYTYKYAIFNNNGSSIVDSIDLRTASPGTYEICGLSVNKFQELSLPSVTGVTSRNQYESILNNNLTCAALTTECIKLEIKDVLDTLVVKETICLGTTFEIEGQSYSEPGTYIVGYNGPSCESMTILELSVFNLEATIDEQIDSLSCIGNNVMLDGSGSAGDDLITYSWFTDEGLIRSDTTLSQIQVSQVGAYSLEIMSGNCRDTATIEVVADDSFIELDFVHNVLDCNNQSTLIGMQSSQPLNFVRWDGPAAFSRIGDNIVVSDPGTYLVTVTSVDGCTTTDSVEIIDGYDIVDPVIDPNDITCLNPSINAGVSITDDTGLTFSWSGPNDFSSDLPDPMVNEGGVYFLDIHSENGCTETWNIIIDDVRQFATLNTFTDTLDCANHQVTVGVNSSISTVTYNWTGPNNFSSDESAPVVDQDGLYTVTVTTDQSCVSTTNLFVERDEELPSLIANDIFIQCGDLGMTNLSITTDAKNPVFQWEGPDDFISASRNPSAGVIGTYSVTVMGSNGCPRTGSLDLLPGDDVPNVSFFSDIIDCDAPIQPIIPSDTAGYSFVYVSESGPAFLDKIPLTGEAGNYNIRVTDLAGCFADYIHQVDIDTVTPVLNLSSLEIDCSNDSVRIEVENSIPIRTYLWEGPSGFSSNIKSPFTDFPGVFRVEFTGVNGCVNRDSIQVNENFELPMITPYNSFFTCIRNEVPLVVGVNMNPSTYEWSGPSGFSSTENSPLVSDPGGYKVTVTGPNGCTNRDSVMVGYDTIVPTLSLLNDGFLTCPDPIVTLSGTSDENDITITWIGPDTVIRGGLSLDVEVPGIWTMQVIDTAGCESNAEVFVNTEIDYPDIVVDYNDIDCNVIFSRVNVGAGPLTENIYWNAPISIEQDVVEFNTDVGGIYELLATGTNGCDTTVVFEISKDTIPPDLDVSVNDTITCFTPQVSLSANSMATLVEYLWIGPGGYSSTLPAPIISDGGRYIFQTSAINGCVSMDTIVVEVDTLSPIAQGTAEEITCIASKATLDVLTNISDPSYKWSGPNGFSSTRKDPIAVTPGTYTVSVTGSNGCTGTDELELLADTEAPRITLQPVSYLFCDSSGVNLEVSTDIIDASFSWFGDGFFSDEQRPFVDAEGTYTVYATGPNGCRSFDTTRVVVDTRLPNFLLASSDINCRDNEGSIIAESVQDDMSYRWEGPNGFTSTEASTMVSDSGTYFMIVQGKNLCVDTQSVHVAIDIIPPSIGVFQEGILQCEVNEIRLNASQSVGVHSLNYTWTTTDGVILSGESTSIPVVRGPGTYDVTVTDNINFCRSDTSLTVIRTDQEFDDFILDLHNPSCVGFKNGSITYREKIGGYGKLMFSLDGGPFVPKEEFRFLEPGTYTITARDSLGCMLSKEVTLDAPRDISINAGPDRIIELGGTTDIELITNVPPDSVNQIIWSDTTALICTKCLFQTIRPIRTILYEIELVDLNGCRTSDDVLINVTQSVDIALPNVIRPLSTNGNEKFFIAQTKGIQQVNYLSIFDRWGNRMFHAENFVPGDENISWDGFFLNEPALPGVYPLVAEFLLENGETIIHHSDVTIIR